MNRDKLGVGDLLWRCKGRATAVKDQCREAYALYPSASSSPVLYHAFESRSSACTCRDWTRDEIVPRICCNLQTVDQDEPYCNHVSRQIRPHGFRIFDPSRPDAQRHRQNARTVPLTGSCLAHHVGERGNMRLLLGGPPISQEMFEGI